jgi:hypothetical protein
MVAIGQKLANRKKKNVCTCYNIEQMLQNKRNDIDGST